MRSSGPPRVLAPDWYAERIGPPLVSHANALAALPRALRWAASHNGPARGVALAWMSRGGLLAVIKGLPGSATALFVCAATRRRPNVVVLEFIRRPNSRSRFRAVARELARRLVEVPALRRGMAAGHTLTSRERVKYAASYRLEEGRLSTIMWPLCRSGVGPLAAVPAEGTKVLSSGRAGSDWETLFAASAEAEWALTVICAEADAERVRRLARDDTLVLAELSRAEHDEHLRQSDVYVMAVREMGVSAGHVRLMSAVEAGVPVVASEIEALDEYVVPGETALLVSPGDPDALRRTVDRLLQDPGERRRLRDAALARARSWSYDEYFDEIRALILSAAEQ